MAEDMFCPLKTNNEATSESQFYCDKTRCAWWTGSRCSILQIADALESLATK